MTNYTDEQLRNLAEQLATGMMGGEVYTIDDDDGTEPITGYIIPACGVYDRQPYQPDYWCPWENLLQAWQVKQAFFKWYKSQLTSKYDEELHGKYERIATLFEYGNLVDRDDTEAARAIFDAIVEVLGLETE